MESIFFDKQKMKKYFLLFVAFFCVLSVVFFKTFKFGHIGLNLLFGSSLALAIVGTIDYSFDSKKRKNVKWLEGNKYSLAVILLGVFIFLPIISSTYYYYDEYWMFPGHDSGLLNMIVSLGRVHQALLSQYFSFVNPTNIFIVRGFQVFFAISLTLIINQWMVEHSNDRKKSFLISVIIGFSSAMIDSTGYAAILSYTFGLVLASLSVVYFDKAIASFKEKKYNKSIILLIFSLFMIINSLHAYQISITIIFFMYAIKIFYSSKDLNIMKDIFSYLPHLLISGGIYKISLAVLISSLSIQINSRASMISTLSQLINKIIWFFAIVIPASIKRIVAIFTGRMIFSNKNYWYHISAKDNLEPVVLIFAIIILGLIIFALFFQYMRDKRLTVIILLLLIIPASYSVFLILEENGYLTYYAYPLISVLLFYMLNGIYNLNCIIIDKISAKYSNKNFALFILCIVVCFQSNIYARQFWVEENNLTYQFIKNSVYSIITNDSIKKIHIYGVPNYGQANVYSKFATELALNEFGKNINEYQITMSDNQNYMSRIEKVDFELIIEKLTREEAKKLETYYVFESTYSQYNILYDKINNKSLAELKYLFNKSGYIPENEEKVKIIDLTWVRDKW